MTEQDCLSYCYRRGFDWGGLYEIFSRVSCWCCPLQSLEELRKLYRHFPDLWRQLEEWDESTWRTFLKNYSVRQLAARFDFEDRWQAAGGNIRKQSVLLCSAAGAFTARIGGDAMPEIKTREVAKGTVKAIDKSAMAAERMKSAYIRTKDKADHSLWIVIIIICLIGLIVGSCFGIFFSGEDSGTGQTMRQAVQEINADYQSQIDTTRANIAYDELEMSGSRAVWPEVLAVYAVKPPPIPTIRRRLPRWTMPKSHSQRYFLADERNIFPHREQDRESHY